MLKNTSVLMFANVIQPLLSFYFIITITRYLGAGGLGEYSTIFYYQAIFQIFSSFGIRNLVTRDIAQQPEMAGKYMLNGTLVVLPFSLLNILLMVSIVYSVGYNPHISLATAFLSLSLIPGSLADVSEGIISWLERLSMIGFIWIVENFFRVVISIWLVWNGYGIMAIVLVFVIIKYIKAIYYYWYIIERISSNRKEIDIAFAWKLTKKSSTFALIMAFVIIYWKADVLLLSKLTTMKDVGIYTAAYRFLFFGMIIVDSFINSLFPVISNMFSNSNENFELTCQKSLQILFSVTVPMAVFLSLFAKPIILFLFGQKLIKSVAVLRWLIWVIVPYSISQIFAYAMIASKKQNYDLVVNLIGMIVNLILNWIFIHEYGFIGAAYAAICAITIYVIIQIPIITTKILNVNFLDVLVSFVKISGAAFFMAVFILYFKNQNIIGVSIFSFLVYLFLLVVFRAFSKRDKELALKFLKKTSSPA